jgi:hypothetical protein
VKFKQFKIVEGEGEKLWGIACNVRVRAKSFGA